MNARAMIAEDVRSSMKQLLLHGKVSELLHFAEEVHAAATERGDAALAAEATHRRGQALFELFQYEPAHACFAEALAARSALAGPRDLLATQSAAWLASLAWTLDRAPEALALHRRALAALPETPRDDERSVVADILRTLGVIERRSRGSEEALPLFRRALELLTQEPSGDELEIAGTCIALGMAEQSAKHEANAARLFERAHEIRTRILGEDHEYVAYTTHHLGALAMSRGDLEAGRAFIVRALEVLERAVGPDHPNVSTELLALGTIEVMMEQSARALPLFERAMALEERFFGPTHPHLGATLVTVASIHAAEDRPAQAEPLWRRAVELLAPVPETRAELLLLSLNNLTVTLRAQGKDREILAFAEPLLERWDQDPRVPPQILTALWNSVSEVYYHEGKHTKAEKLLKRALATATKRYGEEARELWPLLHNLVILLRDMGRRHEANDFAERLAKMQGQRN
ncbi:TPR repeat protein [Minicystis rosea]|nr:TPR repeat protein [Minicystis rosea]